MDIIGVYISPKADHNKVIANLKLLINTKHPTVIMGDLNICLMKNKENPITNFLTSVGCTQLVKEATHTEVNVF